MQIIYKYKLTDTTCSIKVPSGILLDVQIQHNEPVAWFLVDPNGVENEHEFRMFFTGHEIDADLAQYTHYSTLQYHNGDLVVHVFYKSPFGGDF